MKERSRTSSRALGTWAVLLAAGLPGLAAQAAAPLVEPRAPGTQATEQLAVVELSTARTEVFVGQPVHVRLTFGLEARFEDERAVQPFGAPLDVPVQLHVEWLAGVSGATLPQVRTPPAGDPTARTASFALDGNLQRARRLPDRDIDGRTFRMHAIDARMIATSPGTLRLAAPALTFAYATRFEDTLFQERAPLDRVDAVVTGAPLEIVVRPVPEAGRPFDFTGAVGDVHVTASVEVPDVAMGESLRLRLEVAGDANLATFEVPRWDELGGFRVLGVLDELEADARVLTLDLAPVSDRVWQVPAVSLTYFDPGPPAGFRIARSEPVDVTVTPAPAALPGPEPSPVPHPEAPRPEPGEPTGPRDPEPPRGDKQRGALAPWVAGIGVLVLVAGVILLRHRPTQAP